MTRPDPSVVRACPPTVTAALATGAPVSPDVIRSVVPAGTVFAAGAGVVGPVVEDEPLSPHDTATLAATSSPTVGRIPTIENRSTVFQLRAVSEALDE